MSLTVIPEAVSIDTQVFVSTGFNFEGRTFSALRTHLASGRLRLVMTDITVREVKARIKRAVAEALAKHKRFRKEAFVLRNSSLDVVKAAFSALDERMIIEDIYNRFEEFLAEADAEIIDTSDVAAGPIFEKYFAEKPPFASGDSKKFEFPDAFAIQALVEWAEDRESHLFVVSGDEPFRKGCESSGALHPKKTLAELLDHVASDDKRLADFIRSEITSRSDEIAAEAKRHFEDYFFWVRDEDGSAEVTVTHIEPISEPEIIEVKSGESIVQMAFHTHYSARLSYSDQDTGIWDSEDKQMMFMEWREEDVERDEELVVEVHVIFEGTDADSFQIEDVDLTDPSEGYGIRTQEAADWPHK